MAAEPSWGPSIGNRPLKWTEIGPTNDPWVISDEFKTFGDNHFWRRQTRTKIFVQKIIHFKKCRIFIQKKYSFFKNLEYSFKINIHFLRSLEYSFKKKRFSRIQNIHSKKYSFS